MLLLLTVTLGAGLVLSGCGDDTPATTPAPAPPPPPPPAPEPEPEPPAPEPPATPTGLHVDETTQTSITWHWNAVEGAIGYAAQVSMDEMFDDTDTITPTTETHFTVSDLEPETSVYLRVAAAAGTLEEPLLSAWTTHVTGMSAMPPPPPPPPMAPATPTGLMATDDLEGMITWSWDAVEGADGYAVQVSMDEMFDDMDEMTYTMEPMHTVSDLGYSETLYARVASTSGEGEDMLMSMFTTHATGMSMAEPPAPPPPPAPAVMVTFSLEKGEYLEADDGRNAATAKAFVNSKIMVESNTDAIITPMFLDDANGVTVIEGDNMPFGRVTWGLLQSKVLSDGATFMVQRAEIGANQDMEPMSDVAYVTCGPFECTESSNDGPPPVPALSIENSTVCNDFTPEASLQVGFVDNNGVNIPTGNYTEAADGSTTTDGRPNDGVDVGWVTDSKVAMTVKHHFSGVARGQNFTVTGVEASKGSSMALAMATETDATTPIGDGKFKGALLVGNLGTTSASTDDVSACADNNFRGDDPYTDPRSGLHKPDSCFRVVTEGDTKTGINYLGGYSIELAAKDAGVSWGKVAWDPNPFKDLKCDSMTYMATDVMEADVCELFEEEVDRAVAKKWGGSKGTTVTFLSGDSGSARPPRDTGYSALPASSGSTNNHLVALQIEAPDAESRRFASLWYNDNDKRTDSKDKSNHDLYATDADPLHIELVDEDGDSKYGDFGKVDFNKPDPDDDDATLAGEDGKAEGAAGGENKCSHSDGEGCNGMLEETVTVTFDAGLAIGCTDKREVTITCEWDANGEMGRYRADDHTSDDAAGTGFPGFVTDGRTGTRVAGYIGAFAKCTVN